MTVSTGQLPNVFLIGAPRCGTTALSTALAAHPDVYMPEIKEPHYFLSDDKPFAYNGPGDRAVSRMWTSSFDDYLKLYRTDAPIRIDASTSYFQEEGCVERILERVPDAKFIVCLRDPVDRAASAFGFFRSMGLETAPSLAEALQLEDQRRATAYAPGWGYRAQGLYFDATDRLFSVAPADRVCMLSFDAITGEATTTGRLLDEFLALSGVALGGASETRNGAHAPRNRLEAAMLSRPSKLRRSVASHAPNALVESLKARRTSGSSPAPALGCPDSEIRDLFVDDIERTASIAQMPDISRWTEQRETVRPSQAEEHSLTKSQIENAEVSTAYAGHVRPALRLAKQGLLTTVANRPAAVRAVHVITRDPRPAARYVSTDTDVVVEGFGGSANTFVVSAIRKHETTPLHVAHHVHTPSQITKAAELGIPAMVVVRDPLDAVASLYRRGNIASVDLSLVQYIQFHKAVLSNQRHLSIFRYEDATSQLDRCFEHFPEASTIKGFPDLVGHPTLDEVRDHRPGGRADSDRDRISVDDAMAYVQRRGSQGLRSATMDVYSDVLNRAVRL